MKSRVVHIAALVAVALALGVRPALALDGWGLPGPDALISVLRHVGCALAIAVAVGVPGALVAAYACIVNFLDP